MNVDIRELRAQRAALISEARAILDRAEAQSRELTSSEQRDWQQHRDEVEALGQRIEREEQQEALDLGLKGHDGGPQKFDPADGGGVGYNPAPAPGEVRLLRPEEPFATGRHFERAEGLSLGRCIRGVITGRWDGAEEEKRTMLGGSDTLGGYLLPEPVSSRIIDLARNKAVVFKAGAITVPMADATLHMARVSGDPTGYWRHENVAITKSDMTFERITMEARTLGAIVSTSIELLEDAQNLTAVVENALSQALALELDRAALRGIGAAAEPLGVRNWSGINTVDMGTNGGALDGYDNFVTAIQAIWEANGEPNAIIFAPRTAGDLARKKDGQGLPLAAPKPYEDLRLKLVSNQIPIDLTKGTAGNASEAFVGDFKKLLVGIRREVTIEASRAASDTSDSAFRQMQVWIRAYLRVDVMLEQEGHFTLIDGITPDA